MIEHKKTICDFITNKLIELEAIFLELSNFVIYDNQLNLFYDKSVHKFKPQPENKTCSYTIELKSALEDITIYSKNTLVYVHPLLRELNKSESKKINHEFHRLIHLIDNCDQHLLKSIHHMPIPGILKSGLLSLAESLKFTIRECEILDIEIFADEIESDLERIQENSPETSPFNEGYDKKILLEITSEVDEILNRLPFATSGEERARIIEERFIERTQIKKMPTQSPLAEPSPIEFSSDEWE